MFGGAGINALKLTYICANGTPEDSPQQMLRSIEMLRKERVDIHLGNHPGNNHTLEKREKQLQEGGNPFIDGESWGNFLDELQKKAESIIADNEALVREMDLLLGEESQSAR